MPVLHEYQIKDVVQLTGFSASTLRYYEEIGLLQPERTPAGYRIYDRDAVELLAFVARAKQLGCTLEEIRVLATAWTGGECGPVQDRLRRLVADKITDAQQHIAQLLTHELKHAAQQLQRHRPNGPCDDQCGCLAATIDNTTTKPDLHHSRSLLPGTQCTAQNRHLRPRSTSPCSLRATRK